MAGGKPRCGVETCTRASYAKGLCEPHYRRLKRTGRLGGTTVGERPPKPPCGADGCTEEATERGLCHGHYQRLVRQRDIDAGTPLARRPRPGPPATTPQRPSRALRARPATTPRCTVEGCTKQQGRARRLCQAHYRRWLKYGDVRAAIPLRPLPRGVGYLNHGYRVVPIPPTDRALTGGETPYPEHRFVMAKKLGRALWPDESVHHRNGDRLDNRPENLELWSRWQPTGQRVEDKIEWARQILAAYAAEPKPLGAKNNEG